MSADLPDWRCQAAESWQFTLALGKAAADSIAAGVPELEALDPAPVLVVSEPDPAAPDRWQLDAYFEGRPEDAIVDRLRSAAGSDGDAGTLVRVEDADWVTISQAFLPPIRAGRFHVHTAAHADSIPAEAIAFRIEASRAFGTGHHETTSGCLEMLSTLADEGAEFGRIADIGTGTGLLAFAGQALWPDAHVVATDVDPVALPVVAENMIANGIAPDAITLAVADGLDHPTLSGERFGLVLANILAGPLIALAPEFARVVAPGGTLVLAGLLTAQESDLVRAFHAAGFADDRRLVRGDWTILGLRRANSA